MLPSPSIPAMQNTIYKEESTAKKRITQGVVDLISMIVLFASYTGVYLGLVQLIYKF